jgi:hypothetical protein
LALVSAQKTTAAKTPQSSSHPCRLGTLLFAGLIAFYLAIAVAQSSLKLLWVDELITLFVARQPGPSGIWRALAAGTDPNPPLIHLLVQLSTLALGNSGLAIRLPAILSVLLAIVAMWWMLRRWVRPSFAAVGILAFMATRGFDYAYDARSYAPLMGFSMGALALWISSGELTAWRRFGTLSGMSLMLAAGLSSNYYGVLAFFPLAAGEAVRTLNSRHLRPAVWIAMGIASLPFLAYLQLIRHNIAEFGPHAWNRPHLTMVALSYLELVEGVFWPVLGMALWMLWRRRPAALIPTPELAAVAVFLLYPILGFAIAIGGAGMISPRCVVPVCCAFGLAAGVLAQHAFGRLRYGALGTVLFLLLWVSVREGFCASLLLEQRKAFFALRDDVERRRSPHILVADSSFVLPLWFYSSLHIRNAIIVPIDFDAIHRYETDDSGEQNLWSGRQGIFPLAITSFSDLPRLKPGDLIIARPGGWLKKSLEAEGIVVAPVPEDTRWVQLGGVFTPLGHFETRLMTAIPKPR